MKLLLKSTLQLLLLAALAAGCSDSPLGTASLADTAAVQPQTPPSTPSLPVASAYHIDVRYLGTASPRQQQAVASAVQRWRSVITRDLPDIPLTVSAGACFTGQPALNKLVDDLLLFVEVVSIDGAGKTLAEAGPCFVRVENSLPIIGRLKLDVTDLDRMEAMGTLDDVVLHEIGHVLGIGTLWPGRNLLVDRGGADPGFNGANALAAYLAMGGLGMSVPVENTGTTGTRDGHWRESTFGDELMTGWISGTPNPLSALTIASLLDLGYGAEPAAANAYALGGARPESSAFGTTELRSMQRVDLHGSERMLKPKWKVDRHGRQQPQH